MHETNSTQQPLIGISIGIQYLVWLSYLKYDDHTKYRNARENDKWFSYNYHFLNEFQIFMKIISKNVMTSMTL